LTLTLLPNIKRSFKQPAKFQFLNNRHLIAPPPRLTPQGLKGKARARDLPKPPKGEPISPLLALRAFAIATTGVMLVAGGLTVAVARILDVRDVSCVDTRRTG
jgi:hypothetical protein